MAATTSADLDPWRVATPRLAKKKGLQMAVPRAEGYIIRPSRVTNDMLATIGHHAQFTVFFIPLSTLLLYTETNITV